MRLIISVIMVAFLALISSAGIHEIVRDYRPLGIKEITSYKAVVAQCDSEPDIGAHGRVAVAGKPTGYWAACNFLPFHTRFIIPKLTGNTIWEVRDRTSKKVGHRIDLLFPLDKKSIGLQHAEVFIYEGK